MAPWNPKANDLFLQAAEIAAPEDRRHFLDQQCDGDAALREQVESLLSASAKAGSFLNRPAVEATTDHEPIAERPGTIIGPYKLMEQIGEGGMGLVFVAEQQQPVRRKVALKIIKPGMDTREVVARFEAERQALALMDHPNIARVFDAGATDSGRPFFVMELVKGVPIVDYCDQQQLTARERLELFLSVCQAVQHAHTKGIIHRDLKPSNILVAPHDGVPVVKVIDFGVAKALGQQLTDKTIYTRFAQMIGTPLYMSPEQAEINALDVDIRSDVYSLGVLLYELLTGTTPFDRQRFATAAFDEIRRIIQEEEPPKPSTRLSTLGAELASVSARRKMEPGKLSSTVKGDLDWIVMKALEKDRRRRYETASGFAADVRRFLAEEPIEARPPSAWYRLRKYARRNRVAVYLTVLLACTVLAVVTNHLIALQGIRRERDRAVVAEAAASLQLEEANREKERAEDAEADARAALEFFLTKLVATVRPKGLDGGMGHDVTVRAALEAAERDLEGAFAGSPKVEAVVRDTLGQNLVYLGEAGRAIQHLDRAIKLRREEFGPDHIWTHQSMHNLANAYLAVSRIDEALALMEDLVPRVRKSLGEDHPHHYRGLINFAAALSTAGQFDRARIQLEEALAVTRRVLGGDDPMTLFVQSDLGDVLRLTGQSDKAVPMIEDALKRASAKLASDHLLRIGITNHLALAYHAAGKREEALALLEKTLTQAKESLPEAHQCTLLLMSNLAEMRAQEKQYDRAVPLFEKLLAASASRTPGGLDVAVNGVRLGECYYQLRQYDKAEPVLRQGYDSLRKFERNLPSMGADLLVKALDRLEQICLAQGRKDEAAKYRVEREERKRAMKKP